METEDCRITGYPSLLSYKSGCRACNFRMRLSRINLVSRTTSLWQTHGFCDRSISSWPLCSIPIGALSGSMRLLPISQRLEQPSALRAGLPHQWLVFDFGFLTFFPLWSRSHMTILWLRLKLNLHYFGLCQFSAAYLEVFANLGSGADDRTWTGKDFSEEF